MRHTIYNVEYYMNAECRSEQNDVENRGLSKVQVKKEAPGHDFGNGDPSHRALSPVRFANTDLDKEGEDREGGCET